jgi:hypothetical protein
VPNYLLSCECGQTHTIGVAQAGGQVACTCGKLVEVPPLRKLRHLPLATSVEDRSPAQWSARNGAIVVCIVLAGLLGGLSLWSWLNEPAVPTFDAAVYSHNVEHEVNRWTPVEAWQNFIDVYRPMAEQGFAVMESPDTPAIRTEIAKQQFYRKVMLAAVGVIAAAAFALLLWPVAKRRPDKKGH